MKALGYILAWILGLLIVAVAIILGGCRRVVKPATNYVIPPIVKDTVRHIVVPVTKALTPPVVQKIAKGVGKVASKVDQKVEGKPKQDKTKQENKGKKQARSTPCCDCGDLICRVS